MARLPLKLALILFGVMAMINLWVFGRFTVDDAFITWRYGQNLVEVGVWAFNRDGIDVTQAYTNPVFAALSILPALMGWDMVLTFKLVSLAIAAGLVALLAREATDRARLALILLALAAVPATIAHTVSGLETLLYCGALALWFLWAQRGAWRALLGCTLLLCLTRPEAWVLVALHPLAMLSARDRPPLSRVALHIGALAGAGALYAAFHLSFFGHVLPNTFFVKQGDGFTLQGLWLFAPYAVPLAWVAWQDKRLGALMALFLAPVIYSYAGSDLLMNYLQRFPFQIAAPVALVCAVLVGRQTARWPVVALLGYVAFFAWDTRSWGDHLGIANYYPRLLDSHVAMGRALEQAGSPRIAVGDAGAIPYHSRAVVLDTIGLGSARVAHEGLTSAVITDFAPSVVFRFADAEGARAYPPGFEALDAHVQAAAMPQQCVLVYAPFYRLLVHSAAPLAQVQAACEQSRVNDTNELTYFLAQIGTPPWAYWRE